MIHPGDIALGVCAAIVAVIFIGAAATGSLREPPIRVEIVRGAP